MGVEDEDVKAPPYSIGSDVLPGLSKLIEECGEVLQIAGKLLATGGAKNHWSEADLHSRLEEELADLNAAMTFFVNANEWLNLEQLDDMSEMKYNIFVEWHKQHGGEIPTRLDDHGIKIAMTPGSK